LTRIHFNKNQQEISKFRIGEVHGELTIIGYVPMLARTHSKRNVYAMCSCGYITTYRAGMMPNKCKNHNLISSVGQKYGELLILEAYYKSPSIKLRRRVCVLAKCSCGTIGEFYLDKLKQGNTKSCGCHSFKDGDYIRPEIAFLNELEPLLLTRGLTIERQYFINGYRIDAYCPELNLAIEYDEAHHRTTKGKEYDIKRQADIEDILHCTFIRVSDNKTHQENINIIFDFLSK